MDNVLHEPGTEETGGDPGGDGAGGEAVPSSVDRSSTDRDEESRPSIQALLTAFRAASRRRAAQGGTSQSSQSGSRTSLSSRSASEDESEEQTPEPAPQTASEAEFKAEPTSQLSPAAVVRETAAAFRKAERRDKEARSGESPAEESRPEEPHGDPTDEAQAEGSTEEGTPREESSGQEVDEESGPAEDLAPAFRRVLSEQSGPDESEEQRLSETEKEREETSMSVRGEAPFLWVIDASAEQPEEASVSASRLSTPRAREAEAFLLRGKGADPYRVLRRIRGHPEPKVYLKPVFWQRVEEERSPVAVHVDGQWRKGDREAFEALREKATAINSRIEAVAQAENGGGVELRVLRFMATRNQEFSPQRTVENSDGFVYPKLTPLLERESKGGGGELARILSMLEERHLLAGEFVMRQHACRNCSCAFLNFEEKCPHCGAADLDADDLVHHFRCAFTGALSEYKKEKGKLVCPKCDRRLKQIGVDYDKPSIVYTCRRCHEEFQDPEVQTTCYQCGRTNPPEQQIEREIKNYGVTALGEETATYGLSDSLLSILKRESRLLDYATFQVVADSEAARIERYQRSTSSLLMVRVTGLKQLRMELGEQSQEVIEEIASAFDNTLRSSDYLSARDEALYLFLLTETDQDGARRAGERLEENIEEVLHQNLTHPPELDIAVQPLRPGIDLDDLAERFLAGPTRDSAAEDEN